MTRPFFFQIQPSPFTPAVGTTTTTRTRTRTTTTSTSTSPTTTTTTTTMHTLYSTENIRRPVLSNSASSSSSSSSSSSCSSSSSFLASTPLLHKLASPHGTPPLLRASPHANPNDTTELRFHHHHQHYHPRHCHSPDNNPSQPKKIYSKSLFPQNFKNKLQSVRKSPRTRRRDSLLKSLARKYKRKICNQEFKNLKELVPAVANRTDASQVRRQGGREKKEGRERER